MVTIYRDYVLLYSLRNVIKEVAIYKRKITIALHPGKCKQDVVFHITQGKKGKVV